MSGEYGRADGWGEPPGPLKTSGTASLALAAGVLSFICLFGLGGILAIALGWIAHTEIERSQGRLSGKALASLGIGLGIGNLVFSLVGLGVLLALALRPGAASRASAPKPAPTLVAPSPALTTPRPGSRPPPAEVAEAPPELPVLPPRIGRVSIIELGTDSGALESQLLAQLKESAASGEQLVLWTVTADCEPCEAVGRALPDARMQRALSKVRLLRADAASFPVELRRLGVPIDTVPGFTLLDSRARALDHIHGGEWDADIPANIAPVLTRFVDHTFAVRRHPWTRPLRDGETPL